MTEPFRWKNCFADVVSGRYGPMVQAFLDQVVEPSLSALDAQIHELEQSDNPLDDFLLGPTEELRRATTVAFCLSIQSLWEQQIRGYLQGCAKELRPDAALISNVMKAPWNQIDGIFSDLRGISLTKFSEYRDLNFLQLLGNACRHGNGRSMQQLLREHPELWPTRDALLIQMQSSTTHTIENLVIPRELLRQFVRAIVSFWAEAEYIYDESIERKHPSLEAKLVEIRRVRAGRGVS